MSSSSASFSSCRRRESLVADDLDQETVLPARKKTRTRLVAPSPIPAPAPAPAPPQPKPKQRRTKLVPYIELQFLTRKQPRKAPVEPVKDEDPSAADQGSASANVERANTRGKRFKCGSVSHVELTTTKFVPEQDRAPSPSTWITWEEAMRPVRDSANREPSIDLDMDMVDDLDEEVLESDILELPVNADELPTCFLSDYTFYNRETKDMVSFSALASLPDNLEEAIERVGDEFGGFGMSSPCYAENLNYDHNNEDEDDDPPQRVKLGKVIGFSRFYIASSVRGAPPEHRIWILTDRAWYILEGPPSARYRSTFVDEEWKTHMLSSIVMTACCHVRKISYASFVASLPQSSVKHGVIEILGRPLNRNDLDKLTHGILSTIDTVPEVCIEATPLIRHLRRTEGVFLSIDSNSDDEAIVRDISPEPITATTSTPKPIPDPAVVTPLIHRIVEPWFTTEFEVVGTDRTKEYREEDEPCQRPFMYEDPTRVELEERIGDGHAFRCAVIDGLRLEEGDVVILQPGGDDDDVRAENYLSDWAKSKNPLGELWFMQIAYFHKEGRTVQVHGQWVVHGSKTIMQELAHPNVLFWTDECESQPIASILGKAKICALDDEDKEIPGERDDYNEQNIFHVTHQWDENLAALQDLPKEVDIQNARDAAPPDEPFCFSCASTVRAVAARIPTVLDQGEGFTYHGVTYHQGDFVYHLPKRVRKNTADLVYELAQIETLDLSNPGKIVMELRIFLRYDDIVRADTPTPVLMQCLKSQTILIRDERRLVHSRVLVDAKAEDLQGKFYLKNLATADEIEAWVKTDDHFHVRDTASSREIHVEDLEPLDEEEFTHCEECIDGRETYLRQFEEFKSTCEPLRGMDVFAGAGGLSTGLDNAGHVKTLWAIEFWRPAAESFQANHPGATVWQMCVNLVIKHALNVAEGNNPPPLETLKDPRVFAGLKGIPKPGDVDILYGGFPCQGFSGANHHKKVDDPRNSLVTVLLSWAEFLRPKFIFMENVLGLLHFSLMATQNGQAMTGGSKMGIIKVIYRTVATLRYQVHFKVLQAGQYGSPQGRQRVIVVMSEHGAPLPSFPNPTHGFQQSTLRHKLPTGFVVEPVSRSSDINDVYQHAPMPRVSVDDALSDLRAFGWSNPALILPNTAAPTVANLPLFNAVKGGKGTVVPFPGYPEGTRYVSEQPFNRYQQFCRGEGESDGKVYGHQTRLFNAKVVERAVHVKLGQRADANGLPHALKPGKVTRRPVYCSGTYGRVDPLKNFATAMTQTAPNGKGSWVLHPTQPRTLTPRESARAQGFPDDYKFLSNRTAAEHIIADQYKQLGNAVPVPLSLALGKALQQSEFKEWLSKYKDDFNMEGSPEV